MRCDGPSSPKEEDRGEDSKGEKTVGGEGGEEGEGRGGNSEGSVRLEQQSEKPKTEETVGVERRKEIQLEEEDLGKRVTEKRAEDEAADTDERGETEGSNTGQCTAEEDATEGDKDTRLSKADKSTGETGRVGNPYWGVTRGGELPPSVSACFEVTPSFLARVQGRLLSLLGRANRYCLPPSIPAPPGMPLEVLRRKVKEARHRLFHHARTAPSKTPQKDKSSASESSSVSESSAPAMTPRGPVCCTRREEPLQKYWGGEEGGGGAGAEEEIELLQQFLNLQHLARSRKHSAQLRRIRDSLLLQVRSRPNSMVAPPDPTPPRPPQVTKNDRQQLRDFLLDIGFVQDYSILNRHGYDLATAAHMDALDLAGAGVTEPLHRMALKHELNLVQRPPQIPEEVPETVDKWLEELGLTDYVDNFHLNGIYCPLAAINLNKRDLQLMGVYMQGHRKKILLSLAAIKESLFRR
ncbi:uncharacterized protein LOC126996568 isoform X2 [Eriocheir sinensis]|uniref:uncharacterized protein LOC126996568 isoform X2 n=1 Tax=Eriocheir sinensis TaxID=95602 RepID=UPI0021C64AC4|nr:uncharacterized protein LOC126996568 isoform X2 [Eriocheir sinensis]